jgi:hypothetical protein
MCALPFLSQLKQIQLPVCRLKEKDGWRSSWNGHLAATQSPPLRFTPFKCGVKNDQNSIFFPLNSAAESDNARLPGPGQAIAPVALDHSVETKERAPPPLLELSLAWISRRRGWVEWCWFCATREWCGNFIDDHWLL